MIRQAPRRFVLFDRDGTLIVEKDYLSDPRDVELIPGAGAALQKLQQANWGLALVTNQSGIARGYFDVQRLTQVHDRLAQLLADFGVRLDGIYICPHGPDDGCDCRKPLPGLVEQARAVHGFDPRESWVVGDKDTDVRLAHAVGARSILVRTGYGRAHEALTDADFVVDNLLEAATLILSVDPNLGRAP
jgi:D-glycero-D-manno-heptose 1,7-bisphosphate phosphatase